MAGASGGLQDPCFGAALCYVSQLRAWEFQLSSVLRILCHVAIVILDGGLYQVAQHQVVVRVVVEDSQKMAVSKRNVTILQRRAPAAQQGLLIRIGAASRHRTVPPVLREAT
jgi:hypothetical protein